MLPIANYKDNIVNSVNDNAVTIITAETGAGKSTQICQYLYEAGYDVIVTEPRRIAAVTLADRVSEELGDPSIVGFHTGYEKSFPDNMGILFCTDGVQLVKELAKKSFMPKGSNQTDPVNSKPRVIIIDEAHEWNLNIEALVAWVRRKVDDNWGVKIVITSATIEHDDLSTYFNNAPVLSVPGTLYPVEIIEKNKRDLIPEIRKYSEMGKNILVFLPGKGEIENTRDELYAASVDAKILPLHGELSMAEQKECFKSYPGMSKIILATNVAQTSVTISDINVVIDTGTERRIEIEDGIQGLFIKPISLADCMQRKGRAGRTQDGIYVLCGTPLEDRKDFAVPEIKRLILDQMVLRLMNIGIDATELNFFHQPDMQSIVDARITLHTIGAIQGDTITDIGKKMLELPISVKQSRMIIEADKYGVVDDVITIASILEIGSLVNFRETNYSMLTDTDGLDSDLLAELNIWNDRQGKKIDFKKEGLFAKNFFRVKDLREKIIQSIEKSKVVALGTTGNREDIKISCFLGMLNNIYSTKYGSPMDPITKNSFQFDKSSCVSENASNWVTGFPMRIEYTNKWGYKNNIDILKSVTSISEKWVKLILPHMFRTEFDESEVYYYKNSDCVRGIQRTYFGNIVIDSDIVDIPDHPDYERLKAEYEEKEARDSYWWSSNRCISPPIIKRQESILIDGIEFPLNYSYFGEYTVDLSIEDLKTLKTTSQIKMDNGSMVYLRSKEYPIKDKTIPLLIAAISKHNINASLSHIQLGIPKNKTSKYQVILNEYLPHVKMHEITDAFGNVTRVYMCLTIDKDNNVNVNILKNKEEALTSTTEVMKYVIDMVVSNKYPVKKFQFKIDGKMTLTSKGNKVYKKFLDFVNECKSEINKDNIQEYIEMIDEYFNEVIEELEN